MSLHSSLLPVWWCGRNPWRQVPCVLRLDTPSSSDVWRLGQNGGLRRSWSRVLFSMNIINFRCLVRKILLWLTSKQSCDNIVHLGHSSIASLKGQECFLVMDIWYNFVREWHDHACASVGFVIYQPSCPDLVNPPRAPHERMFHIQVENMLGDGPGPIQCLSRTRSSALDFVLSPVDFLAFWPAVPRACKFSIDGIWHCFAGFANKGSAILAVRTLLRVMSWTWSHLDWRQSRSLRIESRSRTYGESLEFSEEQRGLQSECRREGASVVAQHQGSIPQ